jgi:hypothetical protein
MYMSKSLKICLFLDKFRIGLSFMNWEVWELLIFLCQQSRLVQPKCLRTTEVGFIRCLLLTLQEQFTSHGKSYLHFWTQSQCKKSKFLKITLKKVCLTISIPHKFNRSLEESSQIEHNSGIVFDYLGHLRSQKQSMTNLA